VSDRLRVLKEASRNLLSTRIIVLGVVAACGWTVYRHPPVESIARQEVGVRLNRLTGTSTRLGEGIVLVVAVALTAMVHVAWTFRGHADLAPATQSMALAIQGLSVVLFTAWPFLAAPRLRRDPYAWPAAALAGPAWFLALRHLWELRFGDAAIGLLPIVLGVVALVDLIGGISVIPSGVAPFFVPAVLLAVGAYLLIEPTG